MKIVILAFSLLFVAWASPAHAQDGRWTRVRAPHFTVYSDGERAAAVEAARTLESFDTLLRLITGVRPEQTAPALDVFMLRQRASLNDVATVGPNVYGFYSAGSEHVAAYAVYRRAGSMDADDILLHEYAHHFMFQFFPTLYPAWYVEGFAEYMATAVLGEERFEVGRYAQVRADWIAYGGWLPMGQMLAGNVGELTREERAMFYAQSWLMVHYIFASEARKAALRTYISALVAGGDVETAFTQSFGVSPTSFQSDLRRYAQSRLSVGIISGVRRAPADGFEVMRLPASADELLLPLSGLRRQGIVAEDDNAEGAALAERVRAEAARHGADPFARAAGARADIFTGETARARATLQELVAAAPTAEMHYLLGVSYLVDARAEPPRRAELMGQARVHFAAANRLQPDNAATLFRYAEATYSDPARHDNAFDVLLHAQALAPQVDEFRMQAAAELIERERYDEGVRMLRLIANHPHAGPHAQLARSMIEDAESRSRERAQQPQEVEAR